MVNTAVWHIEHREELLKEIGKVTVRWAALDLLLVDILEVALANRAAAVSLILEPTNAGKQRLETFKDVIGASRLTESERREIIGIAQRFKDIIGNRNTIVHSPLVTSISIEGKKLRFGVKSLSKDGVPREMQDIKKHLRKVGVLLREAEEIHLALQDKYCDQPGAEE